MMKLGLCTLGLLVFLSLSACGASQTATPSDQSATNTSTEVPAAEALYKKSCLSCHGVNLQGVVGPNLQKIGAELSKGQIMTKIQNGGGGMPPFQKRLDAKEIDVLAEWLALKQ